MIPFKQKRSNRPTNNFQVWSNADRNQCLKTLWDKKLHLGHDTLRNVFNILSHQGQQWWPFPGKAIRGVKELIFSKRPKFFIFLLFMTLFFAAGFLSWTNFSPIRPKKLFSWCVWVAQCEPGWVGVKAHSCVCVSWCVWACVFACACEGVCVCLCGTTCGKEWVSVRNKKKFCTRFSFAVAGKCIGRLIYIPPRMLQRTLEAAETRFHDNYFPQNQKIGARSHFRSSNAQFLSLKSESSLLKIGIERYFFQILKADVWWNLQKNIN